jgi:hypothetical protein
MVNKARTRWLILPFAMFVATRVFAADDPTSEQVYEAARTGHLSQAERMIAQVLRDHARSGKAHYVAAEVYAREGKTSLARQELDTAQALQPGLPFAKPEAVAALRKELGRSTPNRIIVNDSQAHIPWGTVALLLGSVGVLCILFRKRSQSSAAVYSPYPSAAPVPAGMPVGSGAGGINSAPSMGSGIGSGMASGLASGLAIGAGVVAGEELARHFLESGRIEGPVVLPQSQSSADSDNSDMGGSDFGLTDSGTWDDDSERSSADVSGGDDWN